GPGADLPGMRPDLSGGGRDPGAAARRGRAAGRRRDARPRPVNGSGIDLDDADALTRADRAGLLYAAASSGAQVRAAAAAVTDALPTDPDAAGTRALVLIAPRGTG